ncbi:MAG: hypothetical protein HY834_20555 [Devosia nanyangense]|uniref:General secretion pathway protein H n=1 Tax=Devosia nanyangense TaxID=1228055 RepID=A0A933L4N0_9HYPH|nr:hypothetical protein [Devosia nanyangense]
MSRLPSDAGVTVLELVVALAIITGVLAMIATAIHPLRPSADSELIRLSRFVANARTDAILSGRAQLLKIAPRRMSYRAKQIEWAGDAKVEALGNDTSQTNPEGAIVIYPDGSFSGAGLTIRTGDLSQSIDAIFRDGVANMQ